MGSPVPGNGWWHLGVTSWGSGTSRLQLATHGGADELEETVCQAQKGGFGGMQSPAGILHVVECHLLA